MSDIPQSSQENNAAPSEQPAEIESVLTSETPSESVIAPADPAVDELASEQKKEQSSERLFPDNFYEWNGENFTMSVSYGDFYQKEYVLNSEADLLNDNRDDFTWGVTRHPGLLESGEQLAIQKAIPRTDRGAFWANAFRNGAASLQHAPNRNGGQGLRAAVRPGSDYRSALETPNGKVAFAIPKVADSEAPVLSGSAALFRLQSLLGRGPTIQIPLVHSGFWVTLKAPTNQVLINLYEQISQEKITLGRSTHGIVFSSLSAYTARIILETLKDHICDTTLVIEQDKDIFDFIRIPDMNLLLLGWARTIWPKGFNLIRSEVSEEGAATGKVIGGLVDLAKMITYDNTAFTDWQKAHMAQRASHVMKLEAIQRYQQEVAIWRGKQIEINDKVKIELRVPTISEYFVSSQRWIDGVVELVESTLIFGGSEELKNQKILVQSQANIARQYGHWINKFILDEQEVTDPETIDDSIDIISAEDSFNTKFFQSVSEYGDDISFTVIGVPEPNFKEVSPGKRFSRIIPIDPLSHFFNLLVSRAAKIAPRAE